METIKVIIIVIYFIIALVFNFITLLPLLMLTNILLCKAGINCSIKAYVKITLAFLIVYQLTAAIHSVWSHKNNIKHVVENIEWQKLGLNDINGLIMPKNVVELRTLMIDTLTNDDISIEEIRVALNYFIERYPMTTIDDYGYNDSQRYSDTYVLYEYKNRMPLFNWIVNRKNKVMLFINKGDDETVRIVGLKTSL